MAKPCLYPGHEHPVHMCPLPPHRHDGDECFSTDCDYWKKINRVDTLKLEADSLQEACGHKFVITGNEPSLSVSLVPGVFVGKLEGPTLIPVKTSVLAFKIRCSKCSLIMEHLASDTCPWHFVPLTKDKNLATSSIAPFDVRNDYFGMTYIYFSIRISRCPDPECGYQVASDGWDQ